MSATAVSPDLFLSLLEESGIQFYVGVPDSLLKELNACILERLPSDRHVIAANEGAAVSIAAGNFIATGVIPFVYMQNSGFGNCINPLSSLVDPAVMSCPMVLAIGWRGEIGLDGRQIHDEPQHIHQGSATLALIAAMGIPYRVLDKHSDPGEVIGSLIASARNRCGPVALVVRKGTFEPYREVPGEANNRDCLPREGVIKEIIRLVPSSIPIVVTTGMAGRELFEVREADNRGHNGDLLCVGGMGHAVSVSAGIAIAKPKSKIICLDGDGAFIMHMGSLTNTSQIRNLIHIVLNNGAHDSVGGQPTAARYLDLSRIAESCGYDYSVRLTEVGRLQDILHKMLKHDKSCFLEILCRTGSRSDLGRPTQSPRTNRIDFMKFLEEMR
jgi:phosphonopyruvate decarboxylase